MRERFKPLSLDTLIPFCLTPRKICGGVLPQALPYPEYSWVLGALPGQREVRHFPSPESRSLSQKQLGKIGIGHLGRLGGC